ncbi:MAG: class I SAM-dependent methyltransferase [Marinicellaceae bacterium]
MNCPLCLKSKVSDFYADKKRLYWQCQDCLLVFVDQNHYLDAHHEKAVYDLHENSADDIGYRNFLNKLLIPLAKKIKPNSLGLDFGSGPGPAISAILSELGFKVYNFDLYYANSPELLKLEYDFITCTEVIEHLYHPYNEIDSLYKILKPGGFMGIMTKRLTNHQAFKTWHYKNDPTHVCFYSDETFEFIANHWGFYLELINSDTIILEKLDRKKGKKII